MPQIALVTMMNLFKSNEGKKQSVTDQFTGRTQMRTGNLSRVQEVVCRQKFRYQGQACCCGEETWQHYVVSYGRQPRLKMR